MSEMVERTAQAVYVAMTGFTPDFWDRCPKWEKDRCRLYAKAAIEAMRNPTDAMMDATMPAFQVHEHAYGSGHHATTPTLGGDFRSNWTRAVDEALK